MKKFLALLLALVMVFALAACGSGGDAAQGADPVALGEKLLSQAEDMPDMTVVSSETADGADLFQYLSDMAYDKVAGYYLAYASAGTAEEIAAHMSVSVSTVRRHQAQIKAKVQVKSKQELEDYMLV